MISRVGKGKKASIVLYHLETGGTINEHVHVEKGVKLIVITNFFVFNNNDWMTPGAVLKFRLVYSSYDHSD